ncbi:MAG: response regulator [Planctomycetes bacterium]|nr:response regulator [Planctomycetota bacterium]
MRDDAIDFMIRYNYLPESFTPRCILVIDEDEFVLSLMQQLYGESNYQLFHATSGYEAGKLAERNRPNLVLLNLMLQNFDKSEICRHVREKEFGKECKVLAITENIVQEETDFIEKSGIHDCLIKPFTVYQLKEKVDRLLELEPVVT